MVEKEREAHERKRKMWKGIQRVWEERMEKDGDAELCRRFAEVIDLEFIANPTCAAPTKSVMPLYQA